MSAIGGGGQVDFFYIKSDHTGLVKTAGGTDAVTTVADRAIRIGRDTAKSNVLTQTAFTVGDDKKLSVSWTHNKFDAEWNTFLKSVVSRTEGGASSNTEELVDEWGIKVGGTASTSAQEVLMVSYGSADSDGKVPVIIAVGSFASSSGGFTFEADKFVKPSLSFTSRGCQNGAGLNVATALDIWVTATNPNGRLASGATGTLGYKLTWDMLSLDAES